MAGIEVGNNPKQFTELMKYAKIIQSFRYEHNYEPYTGSLRDDIVLIFSPDLKFGGNKFLKVRFYDVADDFYVDYTEKFTPEIVIEDISEEPDDRYNYHIYDRNERVDLRCDYFEYAFIDPIDGSPYLVFNYRSGGEREDEQ